MRQLLDIGNVRAHEPAFDPDPAEYVAWDYAQGFVDGVVSVAESEDRDKPDADGSTTINLG